MTLSPLKSLFPPWNLPNWRQVDDSVRGGSSTSFLSEFSDSEGEHSVIFHGILDTQTLGGAGFASQKYAYSDPPLDISNFTGIQIHYDARGSQSEEKPSLADIDKPQTPTIPRTFTLTLASTPPQKIPHPKSRVVWEADFKVDDKDDDAPKFVALSFKDFVATYRGRPIGRNEDQVDEKARDFEERGHLTLRTDSIYEIGIMCRSHFAQQEGPFRLAIRDVAAFSEVDDQRSLLTLVGVWMWWLLLLPLLFFGGWSHMPSLSGDW